MVSEGFANFIPKEDQPANSSDVNPLETIWIIVDETTYKDPAPKTKTLDELRLWDTDGVTPFTVARDAVFGRRTIVKHAGVYKAFNLLVSWEWC
ncbi:unnamed protein product [Porites evermanni]|uniref:Uncharacterized protein n=1 Tax=Porites evermanni TaxID=104178 RepID=A0ABN8LVG7_9CNID|nr:unnamed protein product [Porites evermanni]